MKASLTSGNSGDFNQRYADTYGWLDLDGKRTFVYIEDVSSRACFFSNGGTVKYHANVDTGVEFEFIPVDRGWFNAVNGEIYFLERRPARQFKRGIARTNTIVYNATLYQVDINYTLLSTIFVDGFDNWNCTQLDKPVAISKHFALTDNYGTIMLYNEKIGMYKDAVITLNNSLFLQELQDTLRRKNIDVRVIVNG